MNRKHLLAAIVAIALAGGLFYFYGGSQTPQRTNSTTETDASECSPGQKRIQRREGRCPRALASIAYLTGMSAGGLCSR